MDLQRLNEIINQEKIHEIYYNDEPVWVQEVHDNIARVGFLNRDYEQNVYTENLYEHLTK